MQPMRDLKRRKSSDPVLRYIVQKPEGTPAGTVLMIHGYADHMRRFDRVAEAWVARGLVVVRFDLRGHGASEGRIGHVVTFDDYLRDVDEMLSETERVSGKPVLFGHSLGGLIAFRTALDSGWRIRGLAMTSPFFGLALEVPAWKRTLGSLASKLAPTLALPSGLKGPDVTRDPDVARAYDSDPLVFPNATSRWFTETSKAQADAFARAPKMSVPVACLLAGADRVASTPQASRVLERVPKLEVQVVDGAYHEILNDPGKEKWIEWLGERIGELGTRN